MPNTETSEEQVARLTGIIAGILEAASLEETAIGRVARGAKRARRDGDLDRAKDLAGPFLSLLKRTVEGEIMPEGPNLDFSPGEMDHIRALARTLPTEEKPRRRRGRPTREEAEDKRTRNEQADFLIGCDLAERSRAVAFIRLLRTNYWLSHFVKNLLRLDSRTPHQVPISEVQNQLDQAGTLEELVGKVQFIGKTGWWCDHPAIAAVADEAGDEIYQYRGDRMIKQLIESAKVTAEALKKGAPK